MTREAVITDFLASAGWADASRALLAGDASARRYERLARGDVRSILMDMPPGSGLDPLPVLRVTDLPGAAIPAARIHSG
jgi:hypothetical protein